MRFLRFPISALATNLSKTDERIYLHLLLNHYHFCGGDYNSEFYYTDRDLSNVTGCSTSSIWKAKKILSDHGYLTYRIFDKNRTYYRINSPNGGKPTP